MSEDNVYQEGDDLPEGKEAGDIITREQKVYEKLESSKRASRNIVDETNPEN
jgi:hypothetical protein